MKSIKRFSLCLLCLVLILSTPAFVSAQSSIEVRCGVLINDVSAIVPTMVGTYFYTSRNGVTDREHVWEIGLISANGVSTIQAPITRELAQHVYFPRVSPDGSKIVFRSLNNLEIVIWEIQTGAVTQFSISQSVADYFVRQDPLSVISFNKLVWTSPNELAIQYFDETSYDVSNPILTLNVTVLSQPLRAIPQPDIATIQLEDFRPPSVDVESSAVFQEIQEGLVVQAVGQSGPNRSLQIRDASTNQLVFQAQPSPGARIVGDPIWSTSLDQVLYVESSTQGRRLVQIDIPNGFQRNMTLGRALENYFGTETGISSTFPPLLSSDETMLAFGYIDQDTNVFSMARYDVRSQQLVVTCDDEPTRGDWVTFWSPSNRFVGYWANGVVKVIDFETGNRYLLPGAGFIGWI